MGLTGHRTLVGEKDFPIREGKGIINEGNQKSRQLKRLQDREKGKWGIKKRQRVELATGRRKKRASGAQTVNGPRKRETERLWSKTKESGVAK